MKNNITFLNQKMKNIANNNRLRDLNQVTPLGPTIIEKDNERFISFCSNDFLGLSKHPSVIESSINAISKYGVGSGASRFVTGNHPLYNELEQNLANYKNTEQCLIFGSGYLTNIGVTSSLMDENDLILLDKLSHACLYDGAKLSGAKVIRFNHNNLTHLQKQISRYRSKYKKCLIITETVFSMDGDISPIDQLYQIATNYDSWLLTDDAHGFGFSHNHHKYVPHIQVGTLSKILGSYGGYVCCDNEIANFIKNTAKSLIYSTALPASSIAAANESVNIIRDHPALVESLIDNARFFASLLDIEFMQTPIIPLILDSEQKALTAANILKQEGYYVSAIRPPTVPPGSSRLRFTFSCHHQKNDIEQLVTTIKRDIL